MSIEDNNSTSDSDNVITEIASGDQSGHRADVTPGKRLKVEASIPLTPTGLNSLNSKLRYLDMNATNGGVARGTTVTPATWVTIFNISGNGYFLFSAVNFETETDWLFRVVVDYEELFGSGGIATNDIVGE